MRIQTTEAVHRFNAQTELVDIALEYAADEITDPGRLFALLCLAGHRELKGTFEESMRQVCITGSGWPAARPDAPDPGQSPHTISEGSTKSPNLREELIQAWDTCRIVQDRIESAAQDLEQAGQMLLNRELCLRDAIKRAENDANWREFCQNSARPGDVANLILERDRLKNVLRLCVARLEEYEDAEGGTALELARRELRS